MKHASNSLMIIGLFLLVFSARQSDIGGSLHEIAWWILAGIASLIVGSYIRYTNETQNGGDLMKSTLFNIRMENRLREKFKTQCKKDGVTMSDVVKVLINSYIEGEIKVQRKR